jgi:CDP-4-dehydro-6-deoxyglucose reductase/ferredoxin-NAD(P)+ reductase (naphthalene dioxygenase ferredoxin-specific)
VIVYDDDPDAPNHPIRFVDGTVERLERATHDVAIISIRLERGAAFQFSAGQFATVDFGVVPPRDYSMACRPDDDLLRFHVRRMPGGQTSGFVHERLATGDRVKLRGPFGTAYWRERHAGPVLMIAGGTGLAPVMSILETMLERGTDSPVRLYFGVRAERDLYLTDRLEALAAMYPTFEWQAVLSAPEAPTPLRSGYVGEVAAADFDSLSGWKAYLAGPPVMVDATRASLLAKELEPRDVHADPYFTAADAARVRQAP